MKDDASLFYSAKKRTLKTSYGGLYANPCHVRTEHSESWNVDGNMNPIKKVMKDYSSMKLTKALLLVLLSAILLVSITGCTQQTSTSSIGNESAAGSVSEGGSNQVVNGITATATQVAVPASVNNTTKLGKFVAFNSTVKNVNANIRYVGTEYWTLRDASGTVYYPAPISYTVNRFGPATTNPGDVVNGILIYDVPQNAQLTSLT